LALWIKNTFSENFKISTFPDIVRKNEKHEKIPQSIPNISWKVKELFGIWKNDFSSKQNMMREGAVPP